MIPRGPIHVPRWAMMPSGIAPGSVLSQPLLDALQNHSGVPTAYQPVIEEGSYEDFKACVFRVCSERVFEIALEDMADECRDKGLRTEYFPRRWNYGPDRQCLTTVELRLAVDRDSPILQELETFLNYLASKYGFVYNKLCISHSRQHAQISRHGPEYLTENRVSVEAEICWLQWM